MQEDVCHLHPFPPKGQNTRTRALSIGCETSCSFGEGDKTVASVEKPANAEWRKQDAGYYNNKPNDKDYFDKYHKEKTKQRCVDTRRTLDFVQK